ERVEPPRPGQAFVPADLCSGCSEAVRKRIKVGAVELESRMRLRGGRGVLVLGDVQLLRADPKPGAHAPQRRGSLDPLEPDDTGVEAHSLVDAARRHHYLDVVEREAQRFPRRACSRSIESEYAQARQKPGTGFRCSSNLLEVATEGLLALDRFEEGLEIPLAERRQIGRAHV